MVRTELREHIFKMLFQIEFNDSVDMPENLNYYFETLEDAKEKDKQYILFVFFFCIFKRLKIVVQILRHINRIIKLDLKKHFKYMFPKFRSYHSNSSLLS